ncbi:MAG: hypothetical protein Q7T57_06425 [Dehalococcoidales bacterium]|nr:hypothetical protein [Dehalococcoidales bacterium]
MGVAQDTGSSLCKVSLGILGQASGAEESWVRAEEEKGRKNMAELNEAKFTGSIELEGH